MKTFLEYVAEDILEKYGHDLSRLAVVFPNKRASLFLNQQLATHAGRPIWSPAYITISDLFRQYSQRVVADPIKLVCELHKSFILQTGLDETLDHFYGWGQILLADFDDLDKNMAAPDKVFANMRDIHELDDISYLTDIQKEAIKHFFSNFSEEHNSQLKERFLKLWSHIYDIYRDFNARLASQGLAYEGALYREVAERLRTLTTDGGTLPTADGLSGETIFLFVGFNLLQPVEQTLFSILWKEGKGHFYWDFDHYYMKSHEAGHYIAQHLRDFPNELDSEDADIYDRFSQQKDITFLSAPTENIQARYISKWLDREKIAAGRQTAIVLCDEHLLQSILHCLPEEVDKINITTGYPLSQSPVASFVLQLFELQTIGYMPKTDRFSQRCLKTLMRHPYAPFVDEASLVPVKGENFNLALLQWMCDLLQQVARSLKDSQLFQESVFRAYTLLNRLIALIEGGDLDVNPTTLQRLIGQLIQSTSIPFHGEPAEGIQIMGVLETRNLDFENILLLSCNEGNMPKGVNDTSFIPYSIRKAYGLTTIDHKMAIYSYYFHRLLQRARNITITYNNSTTDGQTGEMSRFMLQLMVESQHTICFKTLQAGQSFTPFLPHAVEKTPEVVQAMHKHFDWTPERGSLLTPLLTPTAINRYQRCPLLFYYTYVCNLRELDEIDDDEVIDNRIFGNIFHDAAQLIYERITGNGREQVVDPKVLDHLLKSKIEIERAVDEAFQRVMPLTQKATMNGLQLINREVIIHYLRMLLSIDRKKAPFTILGLETDVVAPMETKFVRTTIGGRIDRLDMVDGTIRVVDYKTGSKRLTPLANVEAIFVQESLAKHSDYYLQTLLYSCIVKTQHRQYPVAPALLFIQHAGADDYNPILKFGQQHISDIKDLQQRFGELLRETIDNIFNPDIAFTPTQDRSRCTYCPYKQICNIPASGSE